MHPNPCAGPTETVVHRGWLRPTVVAGSEKPRISYYCTAFKVQIMPFCSKNHIDDCHAKSNAQIAKRPECSYNIPEKWRTHTHMRIDALTRTLNTATPPSTGPERTGERSAPPNVGKRALFVLVDLRAFFVCMCVLMFLCAMLTFTVRTVRTNGRATTTTGACFSLIILMEMFGKVSLFARCCTPARVLVVIEFCTRAFHRPQTTTTDTDRLRPTQNDPDPDRGTTTATRRTGAYIPRRYWRDWR